MLCTAVIYYSSHHITGADRTSLDECSCTALFHAIVYGRTHLLPVLCTDDMLHEVIYPHAAQRVGIRTSQLTRVAPSRCKCCCSWAATLMSSYMDSRFEVLTNALLKRTYACATVSWWFFVYRVTTS